MIKIIAVGKKHESWIEPGLERYQKRYKRPWVAKWELLPHSSQNGAQARQEESRRIFSRLNPDDFVILLDERGENLTSPALARKFEDLFAQGRTPVLVIGGAFGVTEELRQRANLVWSLSALVFPHQLVRLLVAEQIYRAQSISSGGKYHHE